MKHSIKNQLKKLEQRKRSFRQAAYFRGFFEDANNQYTPEQFDSTQYNQVIAYGRDTVPEQIQNHKGLIILDEQDRGL